MLSNNLISILVWGPSFVKKLKFQDKNLRQIGRGVHEFGSDIPTNKQTEITIFIYIEILIWEFSK